MDKYSKLKEIIKNIVREEVYAGKDSESINNLKKDKNEKFKGTKEILRKAGSLLYKELKDIATTTAAKTIVELNEKSSKL